MAALVHRALRRTAAIALVLVAATASPAAGHGGISLASASRDGLSAELFGSTLPGVQSPDGRERVDYTVQLREGGRPVTDAEVTLGIDRGSGFERRRASVVDGAFEVTVDPEDDNWRRWPARMTVDREGTTLSATYEPPDTSAPNWLPWIGALLVPLLIIVASRAIRRMRGPSDS